MNTQTFAQIIGPVIILISIFTSLNLNTLKTSNQIHKNIHSQLVSALMLLFIGLVIILSIGNPMHLLDYSVYSLGCIFIFSGIFRMFFTTAWLNILLHLGEKLYSKILNTSLFIYGVLLVYFSFFYL